jgi:outer membrane protein OmpA-like peptidoglycan-associated protein
MKRLISFAFALFLLYSATAQEKYPYRKGNTVGLHFTLHDFKTAADLKTMSLSDVLSKGDWSKMSKMDPGLAISFSKGLTDNLDVMTRLGYATVEYPRPNAAPTLGISSRALLEADVNLQAKLVSEKYWVSPYVSVGAGASKWGGYYAAYFPMGLGLQVNFDNQYLILQSQYRWPVTGNANNHLFYSLGFATNVGKKKAVVAPPPPVPVAPPAPKDSDGDGIPDSDDACPTVAGIAKFKGCPDTDGDGIPDADDKCPKVPGIAQFNGCPDTDGDGIPDSEDKCPTVAGFARYQGCPIPDTDGDGVNDEVDKCPTIPGVPENAGCPKINFNAKNIQFATGTANLTTGAKAELNKLVSILSNDYPDVRITIEGHTDNVGKPESNLLLSDKRAASVKSYLVAGKVAADRLTSVGYGQDRPVADNTTAEGRAQNRRVEFRVSQ